MKQFKEKLAGKYIMAVGRVESILQTQRQAEILPLLFSRYVTQLLNLSQSPQFSKNWHHFPFRMMSEKVVSPVPSLQQGLHIQYILHYSVIHLARQRLQAEECERWLLDSCIYQRSSVHSRKLEVWRLNQLMKVSGRAGTRVQSLIPYSPSFPAQPKAWLEREQGEQMKIH